MDESSKLLPLKGLPRSVPPLDRGLTRLCRNLCRPYGTLSYFPLDPALRIRLRAGLDSFAPTGLDFAQSLDRANSEGVLIHTSSRVLGRDDRVARGTAATRLSVNLPGRRTNMPLKNSASPSSKKPAPGPRSAVSNSKRLGVKKIGAAKKNRKAPASSNAAKKARRHTAAFSTLKSRQQAVERAKLQIWRHLQEINSAIIKLAESGSYLAAKTLFDFAGLYTLPLEEETASNALPAAPDAGGTPSPPPVNRVEAFLKTMGLDPLSDDEPEPDVAA